MYLSVIIPTHNRSDALDKTLELLSLQDFAPSWEAVVINNNCTDDTNEIVSKWQGLFPVALKYVNEKKPGASAARNAGVRVAEGTFLVFLDNDIMVKPDFLKMHCEAHEDSPGAWITGVTLSLPEHETTRFGRYRKTLYPVPCSGADPHEVEGFGAANVSMLRRQFEELGGFDENFIVASGEDRDLAIRAIECGITILLYPNIIVFHNDWAGSTIRDFCDRQRVYAQSDHYFLQKAGGNFPRHELSRKNGAPELKTDGLLLYLVKRWKGIVGSQTGQRLAIGACEALEGVLPARLVWPLYRITISGAIYRGFQEGMMVDRTRTDDGVPQ